MVTVTTIFLGNGVDTYAVDFFCRVISIFTSLRLMLPRAAAAAALAAASAAFATALAAALAAAALAASAASAFAASAAASCSAACAGGRQCRQCFDVYF
jgi:hypothetical protein